MEVNGSQSDNSGSPIDQTEDKPIGSEFVEKKDETTSETRIPNAGSKTIIAVMLIIISASIVLYKKFNKFRDIK